MYFCTRKRGEIRLPLESAFRLIPLLVNLHIHTIELNNLGIGGNERSLVVYCIFHTIPKWS